MSSIGSGGANSWQASFFKAAGQGNEPLVRDLIQEGSIHGENYRDALRIALQKVAGRGHEPLTRLLLEKGAEVNTTYENEVPALFKAAELGKDKVVRLLLDHGADTESRDRFKRTALFPAAQRNHRNTLRLLLDARADVDSKDGDGKHVLLFLASERSDKPVKWGTEVIQILLGTNIDLEAKDREKRTALLWAAAIGKETLAELLLTGREQRNADITSTNDRSKTALHLAVENNHEKNRTALVQLLLDHGANPHARSDGGWTPLHNAAEKGYTDVGTLLLQYNADVNATTSSKMTPLHWSARNGKLAMVELLLQQDGIRRNYKDSFDQTPMLGAAENGHIEIVKLLSPADDGKRLSTTAHGACQGFQATVVDFEMENRPMNHTKHSVFDLLYGWDEKTERPLVTTLVRNIPAKPTFRWIHLPTNNMAWVEALLTKQFVENSASDVEGFKALEKSFGQLHRGPLPHAYFMRPLCQRMQPTTRDSPSSDLSESATEKSGNEAEIPIVVTPKSENVSSKDHNIPEKQAKDTDKQAEKKGRRPRKASESVTNGSTPKKTSKSTRVDLMPPGRREGRFLERNRTPIGGISKRTERNGNIVLFMPYLHYETHQKRKKMSMAIKRASKLPARVCGPNAGFTCDEMLVQAYLQSSHSLQIRRTLDQFYYHAISTEDRDTDQVVYRYTRDKGKEKKVFMVDQLWLWILDKDLIVTAFPQRWEQPKNDPLNVLDGIIEDMNSKTRPPVKSVFDLAMLISGRCSGVFDRHRLGDEDYQFLDMFESSIGEVTNKETELFKKFNDASVAAAQWLTDQRQRGKAQIIDIPSSDNSPNKDPTFVDTLLDIGEETALLAETKDIRDELFMISMVLKSQCSTNGPDRAIFDNEILKLSILDDLASALLEELKGNHNQQKQADVKKRFREQHKVVETHLKDVERMDKQAEGIYTSLTHLLDLKQKHANAFEARFARDQATFTGRQGQTIMVFTIVTIIFLPMSFLAAFFAIPVSEFPHDNGAPSLPLDYVSKITFGVGFAISIPLITIAFAVDNVGLLIKRAITSLTMWTSSQTRLFSQGRSNLITRDEKNDMNELRGVRKSGEMSRRRGSKGSGDETDSDIDLSPVRITAHQAENGWKDEQDWRERMSAGSRDLERGTGIK